MLLLLLLLPLTYGYDRQDLKTLRPCFERYPNHRLSGMKSYHSEYKMATEEECLHFCALTATRCRSIVFDTAHHQCHFFLDDGAEQAEFFPRMIYFRVTGKSCLDTVVSRLPAGLRSALYTEAHPTTTSPSPKTFKSPVVEQARKNNVTTTASPEYEEGEEYENEETTDAFPANKEAVREILNDQQQKKNEFVADQKQHLQAIKEEKEKVKKQLKEKLKKLREVYPDMYLELIGGAKSKEQVVEQVKMHEGNAKYDVPKKATKNSVVKVNTMPPTTTPTSTTTEIMTSTKSGEIMNMYSEELTEYDTVNADEATLSDAEKLKKSLEKEEEEERAKQKASSLSKAETFAAELNEEAKTIEMDASLNIPDVFSASAASSVGGPPEEDAFSSTYIGEVPSMFGGSPPSSPQQLPPTFAEPEIAPKLHSGDPLGNIVMASPTFSMKRRDEQGIKTGCSKGEWPLWVRFENSEPANSFDAEIVTVSTKEECQEKCNRMDVGRSFTYGEKEPTCQCNLQFDGISLKKSVKEDFSISTSTRFCFAESLNVFANCGYFMAFRDFTLEVTAREQFEGLPPSYDGLQLCIELCALSSEYMCKSASFDAESGKCSLNDADSSTNPMEFRSTSTNNLLYFENSCQRNVGIKKQVSSAARVDRVPSIDALKIKPISKSGYILKEVALP